MSPSGSKLNCQGYTLKADTNRRYLLGVFRRQREFGLNLCGALSKKLHSGVLLKRWRRREVDQIGNTKREHGVAPLTPHMQSLTAGDQHLQPGAAFQQFHQCGSGVQYLLEVVQHQEHPSLLDIVE